MSVQMNVEGFLKSGPIEQFGMLTVTFKEKDITEEEANRKDNEFRKKVLNPNFVLEYIRVLEYQSRGAPHFHYIVRVGEDIRTGFNFEQYQAVQELSRMEDLSSEQKRQLRRAMRRECGPLTTNKVLRGYWALMLDKAKDYGIGRIELVPIRTNAEACGKYVGGYMTKSCFEKQPGGRRTRFVTYSANFKKACTSQFASNGPRGQEWRRKRAAWAAGHGLKEGEEKEFLGPRWAYHYRDQILATPDCECPLTPIEKSEFGTNSMETDLPQAARAESQVPNGINGGDPETDSIIQRAIKRRWAENLDRRLSRFLGRRPFMPDRCLSRSGPVA